ncbi:class I adenylate-forming enzyme family protein [Puniceibacterium sediminis]|uniref:Acyl-CoA synthetase (AMP-forming)/AMP-acid ligase II n=1 Tax=Puniceibacterium sediminis TaxID=1608407 RepID=A0A238UZ78_9RHOB|nr:class I adenylate-forming enzyme family protein [Puniceibacterium sediminis]SNR27495.1 Acyl-CoA synthetase (AMP-forming)/AMP-acid ligase II [Puniceibacterium sediminis]
MTSSPAFNRIHQLLDRNVALRGGETAVIDSDGRQVDWREYSAISEGYAELMTRGGVRPGDRVLIVAENCLSVAASIFGASRIGAWAVPVNARMAPHELDRIMSHADPAMVIFTSQVSKEAAAHADHCSAASVATGAGHVHVLWRDRTSEEVMEEGPGGVAVLLYTTGTTGDPKGVMLSHGNLLYAAKASAELRDLGPGDRVYGALPLTHVFGLASMLMASAHAGATVQLAARFSPAALYQALLDGVTVLPAVPQMHALLMAYAVENGHEKLDSAVLRYVSSGAAPLDPAWKRKAEGFYGIALQNGYGMTESTAGVSGTRNPRGLADISVGPALPGVEIALDESMGGEPGVGEVLTRGPHVMKGYFRNPSETAKAVSAEGWLRTGDLGKIDEKQYLHIVGRCKELIIRGGFNVYPPEVEAALNDHPAVVQSAVIGRRGEGGNEDILAFVQVTQPGVVQVSELKEFVAGRLSNYKRPSRIFLVEALPASATGKILKHRLLSHFADLLEAPAEV